jgi:acetyl esterase/lipase
LHLDVLAAVRYLHDQGTKRVSVVGGSMGGGAAAQAAAESKEREIDLLILLAHSPTAGSKRQQAVRCQYRRRIKPKR